MFKIKNIENLNIFLAKIIVKTKSSKNDKIILKRKYHLKELVKYFLLIKIKNKV